MISVIAGALLMTASSYLGMGVKRIYRERYLLFKEAEGYATYLEREVRHLKTPLTQLTDGYIGTSRGAFSDILKRYLKGRAYGYASSAEVLSAIKSRYLSGADNLIIADFLFGLGKGDLETELTNLLRYQAVFAEKMRKYEGEMKKNGEMYYKLFVLLGIAMMLIVV